MTFDPSQISAGCGAIVAAAGVIATARKWPLLRSKLSLISQLEKTAAQRDDALRERDDLRGMLRAFETGLKALETLRLEIDELRLTQIVSIRYVADLVQHIRDGGTVETMPPVPAELRDDVLFTLKQRAAASAAAVAASEAIV